MRLRNKRRGNLVLVVVIGAMMALVLCAQMLKASRDILSVQKDVEATLNLYDDEFAARLLADEAVKSMCAMQCGRTSPDVTPTQTHYEECLADINSTVFDSTLTYIYHDSAEVFDELTQTNSEFTAQISALETRLKTISVTVNRGLALDQGNFPSGFNYTAGGTLPLQDITLTVSFIDGLRSCSFVYSVEQLSATFSVNTRGYLVLCDIDDTAAVTLQSQSVQ